MWFHAMAFSVGDRVVCNAEKVIGNKPAKQRYGRLFRKEIQGLVHGMEGSGRNKKYMWFVLMKLQLLSQNLHG